MKIGSYLFVACLLCHCLSSQAQPRVIDSFQTLLHTATSDSARAEFLMALGASFPHKLDDSAYWYFTHAEALAQKKGFLTLQSRAITSIAEILDDGGNYSQGLQFLLKAQKIEEEDGDWGNAFWTKREIMWIYGYIGDYKKQLSLGWELYEMVDKHLRKDPQFISMVYHNLGVNYILNNMQDSGLYYERIAYAYEYTNHLFDLLSLTTSSIADVYFNNHRNDSAVYYYRIGSVNAMLSERKDITASNQKQMAKLFQQAGRYDSALTLAKESFKGFTSIEDTADMVETSAYVALIYKENNQMDSAYSYLAFSKKMEDSLLKSESKTKANDLKLFENMNRSQLEQQQVQAEERYGSRVRMIVLVVVLSFVLLLSAVFYRNYKHQQKAKKKIEEAYTELKTTQAQLIQSEKMASLGELTAGIAHEIQNPLNFVNNFSEVNKDLLQEMKEEIDKANYEDVKLIAKDITENEEKINHHGKRADAIVKGMLLHSRQNRSIKEATDINALCSEYLRLAYHGFRAKEKDFNVKMETSFDETIGKINIVPQDIGRVLLNLINNAFYAVGEKMKTAGPSYDPVVRVATKKTENQVSITLTDNGNGIPKNIVDKIFQPFFTTKPTGSGTGLGLSLSYDIVKAHGGEIKVETQEGMETQFSITFPSN